MANLWDYQGLKLMRDLVALDEQKSVRDLVYGDQDLEKRYEYLKPILLKESVSTQTSIFIHGVLYPKRVNSISDFSEEVLTVQEQNKKDSDYSKRAYILTPFEEESNPLLPPIFYIRKLSYHMIEDVPVMVVTNLLRKAIPLLKHTSIPTDRVFNMHEANYLEFMFPHTNIYRFSRPRDYSNWVLEHINDFSVRIISKDEMEIWTESLIRSVISWHLSLEDHFSAEERVEGLTKDLSSVSNVKSLVSFKQIDESITSFFNYLSDLGSKLLTDDSADIRGLLKKQHHYIFG